MDAETRERIKNSDKTLIVCLDNSLPYTAISLKQLMNSIHNDDTYIVTPLTSALDNWFCLNGYKLIVVSSDIKGNHQERCINDMLLGDIGENEKELRLAHNVERLIMSGVYGIETNWDNEQEMGQ